MNTGPAFSVGPGLCNVVAGPGFRRSRFKPGFGRPKKGRAGRRGGGQPGEHSAGLEVDDLG